MISFRKMLRKFERSFPAKEFPRPFLFGRLMSSIMKVLCSLGKDRRHLLDSFTSLRKPPLSSLEGVWGCGTSNLVVVS